MRKHRSIAVWTRLGLPVRKAVVLAALAASAVTVAGCAATVEPAYEPIPDNYYAYPSYYYDHHTVYLVNGRWYYPEQGRWYYYRDEPAELVRRRTYVQQAPPAPRAYPHQGPHRNDYRDDYGHGGGPPPAHRER
jgi:hypothetical protein